MLISTDRQLGYLCEQLDAAVRPTGDQPAQPLAFDTEFVSERRYTPRLCLLQVYCRAHPFPLEAAIDPFTVDLKPLLSLFSDPEIVKILHAGASDLQILWASYGCRVENVFDTQIAGAFLGYGHQAGYAELVRRVADGPSLSKAQQFTDWSARPLTSSQVSYSLDDVRYLPTMYERLHSALASRGRLRWAQSEFDRSLNRATEAADPAELWRKFNLSGLSRRQMGALRETAAVREKIAQSLDKPPSFIVPDLTLLQMAKLPPSNVTEMRSLRGMPSVSSEASAALLEALSRAARLTDDELPRLTASPRPDAQAEVVSGLLNAVTQLRADEHDISRSYLASREQLNGLAAWWLRDDGTDAPDLPVLRDWRRELLGEELLELLDGRLAISLDGTRRGRERGEDADSVMRVAPVGRKN